jgi:transposase
MTAYSSDLRRRVARACDDGLLSRTQIAALFGVSPAWVRRLLQRRRETGSLAASPWNGGPRPKLGDAQRQQLAELVRHDPDATLKELQARLGAGVSVSILCRALQTLRLPLKKKRSGPMSRAGRTSPARGRSGRRPSRTCRPAGCTSSTRRGRTRP